jgi:hypothetical protein
MIGHLGCCIVVFTAELFIGYDGSVTVRTFMVKVIIKNVLYVLLVATY